MLLKICKINFSRVPYCDTYPGAVRAQFHSNNGIWHTDGLFPLWIAVIIATANFNGIKWSQAHNSEIIWVFFRNKCKAWLIIYCIWKEPKFSRYFNSLTIQEIHVVLKSSQSLLNKYPIWHRVEQWVHCVCEQLARVCKDSYSATYNTTVEAGTFGILDKEWWLQRTVGPACVR